MSSYDLFWSMGNGVSNFLAVFYDYIVRYFNYGILYFGFAAFIYWMRWQSKLIKEAKNNPNQLK